MNPTATPQALLAPALKPVASPEGQVDQPSPTEAPRETAVSVELIAPGATAGAEEIAELLATPEPAATVPSTASAAAPTVTVSTAEPTTAAGTTLSTNTPLPPAGATATTNQPPAPDPQDTPLSDVGAAASATPAPTLPAIVAATNMPATVPAATAAAGSTTPHFSGCASRTGDNATIAVLAETTLSGGLVLAAGDEVAVYNPGGTVCAGTAVWSGHNIAVTAWGDDAQTGETDGFLAGELMQFRLWDASENVEYTADNVTYETGDGWYATDSIHVVTAMQVKRS